MSSPKKNDSSITWTQQGNSSPKKSDPSITWTQQGNKTHNLELFFSSFSPFLLFLPGLLPGLLRLLERGSKINKHTFTISSFREAHIHEQQVQIFKAHGRTYFAGPLRG